MIRVLTQGCAWQSEEYSVERVLYLHMVRDTPLRRLLDTYLYKAHLFLFETKQPQVYMSIDDAHHKLPEEFSFT